MADLEGRTAIFVSDPPPHYSSPGTGLTLGVVESRRGGGVGRENDDGAVNRADRRRAERGPCGGRIQSN